MCTLNTFITLINFVHSDRVRHIHDTQERKFEKGDFPVSSPSDMHQIIKCSFLDGP